jgi:hypothetical protein
LQFTNSIAAHYKASGIPASDKERKARIDSGCRALSLRNRYRTVSVLLLKALGINDYDVSISRVIAMEISQ